MVLGVIGSLLTSLAFVISMSSIALKPGMLASSSRLIAKPGFLGFVAGMFVSGNAHSGGPILVVSIVASIVNFGLYTMIAYGTIQLLRSIGG